jgi:two-component sensor histidine kinase
VPAYLFALAAVLLATLARMLLGAVDITLPYATYFPAVMMVALVCGGTAATVTSVVSAIVVWWAFVPPYYVLGPFTRSDAGNAIVFLACCALMIWIVQLYRNAVALLRENERERSLMMSELEHRGKNTFAVVESIVRSSLEEQPERAAEIAGRIRAVSSTNDVINRSPTHRSTIEDILRREFEAYGLGRLRMDGDGVELDANVSRALALILHELVTNAVKYGALSQDGGIVSVHWRTEGGTVALDWHEQGGPAITAPEQFGFGSKLITRTLRALGGGIEPEFRPDGLFCRLRFAAESR